MATKPKIEIFSAGCPLCNEVIEQADIAFAEFGEEDFEQCFRVNETFASENSPDKVPQPPSFRSFGAQMHGSCAAPAGEIRGS